MENKEYTLKNDDGKVVRFEAENDKEAAKIAEEIIRLINIEGRPN